MRNPLDDCSPELRIFFELPDVSLVPLFSQEIPKGGIFRPVPVIGRLPLGFPRTVEYPRSSIFAQECNDTRSKSSFSNAFLSSKEKYFRFPLPKDWVKSFIDHLVNM